jgi:hypothetical protein
MASLDSMERAGFPPLRARGVTPSKHRREPSSPGLLIRLKNSVKQYDALHLLAEDHWPVLSVNVGCNFKFTAYCLIIFQYTSQHRQTCSMIF